jgi:hypothetical protein
MTEQASAEAGSLPAKQHRFEEAQLKNNRQEFNPALAIDRELEVWNRTGRLRIASVCAAGMLVLFLGLLLGSTPALHAQITATISGTVYDTTAGAIPNANITLRNEATDEKRDTVTNSDGVFVFPALQIGTYTVEIRAKGFKILTQTGISVSAAESRKLTGLNLAIGTIEQTVSVQESSQIIPTDNGSRAAVLEASDIETLALGSRDLSELLKVLPGVTTAPNGTSNGPMFNFQNVGAAGSAVGNGLNANGAPNRGGTSETVDGVDINDPGCDCNSIATVNPDMTQEVSVQTSNFGADASYGPVLINSLSKSGTAEYHGEGYIYARNNVIAANDWQSDHAGTPKGPASYYYPGGNAGGPIPFTHKKVLVWGGYERILQNLGNTNRLESYIPTPDMLSGNFGPTAANLAFCNGNYGQLGSAPVTGNSCNDLTGTILPDGTTAGPGTANGSTIPAAFIDPGALALTSFWPKANANPATTPGLYNYNQVIPGIHDGWIYRLRTDFHFNDNNSAYISYQQGFDTAPSEGNGAHIYWTPANAIPYPGGGLFSSEYTKALAGHFVHTFSSTLTNELIASWGYGNFPVGPANPSAAFRSKLGYPGNYSTVFNTGAQVIPSYSTPGSTSSFPDFSQQDIFEPSGVYLVRKEMPAYADNLTKVWKTHTLKIGGYAENIGNIQGASESPNGSIGSNSFGGTLSKNILTGNTVGSPNNPTANFLMGLATSYTENNASPVSDMAYQTLSFYFDDSWKANRRLTIEYGIRFDHDGHWYDRKQVGEAVFLPSLVASDYAASKFDAGVYWHGTSPGVPNSGQPDKFIYADPRFGVAYDIFGTGKSVIRGGWGLYRYSDQYNDYTGALTTAQSILGYGLPGNSNAFLSQLGHITAPTTSCGPATAAASACINGSVNALDPTDSKVPYTASWNLTISQQLGWNTLLEVAYVGNDSQNTVMGGEGISGSGFAEYTNQNKIPLGAFFKPDPITGLTATNPENVNTTCSGAVCNKTADYRPYGLEYGDNAIDVVNNDGYGNYNGLQVSWVKRSKATNFNANYTWSKTLGTGLQVNPYVLRDNYGVLSIDRPQVLNLSGSYFLERPYTGDSKILSGAANGWTISNITTWQRGGSLPALFNNGDANFGLGLQYTTINGAPISAANPLPAGVGTGLSDATYYGTNDSGLVIQPVATCKALKYTCFSAPAIGSYGGASWPYYHGPDYFDSDLALFKNFHVFEKQNLRLEAEAFNWLNHPLPQFANTNYLSLNYQADYGSKAITVNPAPYPNGTPDSFGQMTNKAGAPAQRIFELSAKHTFHPVLGPLA